MVKYALTDAAVERLMFGLWPNHFAVISFLVGKSQFFGECVRQNKKGVWNGPKRLTLLFMSTLPRKGNPLSPQIEHPIVVFVAFQNAVNIHVAFSDY